MRGVKFIPYLYNRIGQATIHLCRASHEHLEPCVMMDGRWEKLEACLYVYDVLINVKWLYDVPVTCVI